MHTGCCRFSWFSTDFCQLLYDIMGEKNSERIYLGFLFSTCFQPVTHTTPWNFVLTLPRFVLVGGSETGLTPPLRFWFWDLANNRKLSADQNYLWHHFFKNAYIHTHFPKTSWNCVSVLVHAGTKQKDPVVSRMIELCMMKGTNNINRNVLT